MSAVWPILTSYDAQHLDRISLPLGGIGTGTIGLGGRGDLRDFEVGNRPAKGFRPTTCLAAVRTNSGTGDVNTRLLEGPLPDSAFEGWNGATAPNHGLPRFADASFDACYPFGQVRLSDNDVPVSVAVQGFNPLVPGDVDASSWPVAVLRYRLTNRTDQPIDASIALAMSNFVGSDGTYDDTGDNHNQTVMAPSLVGVRMDAPGLPAQHEAAGSFVLAALTDSLESASTRTGWSDASWGGELLDFWDDLSADGRLDDRASTATRPIASLCAEVAVPPAGEATVTFVLAWCSPHRRAWRSTPQGSATYTEDVVGNFYAETFPDPWQTVRDFVVELPELERRSIAAAEAIIATSAPPAIVEGALFNLSTLRSPTVFRTADGRFYGWEGAMDRVGSCFGSCSHVWGYEFATSFLFPGISWSMRDTQFALCTDERGHMSFRAGLPVSQARAWGLAAADGQMAALVHLYSDWRLSGDTDRLRALWPAARRAMEFCWIEGGWDADQDGVMEGCQHNTMDVEYYGPNPQMGTWYLAALHAVAEMATALGDKEFAAQCRDLAQSGAEWLDANLFTGAFYRHEVRPPGDAKIAEGLRHPTSGAAHLDDPDLQLADGCLIDQLVGQYAARTVGLDGLLDPKHVATTLDMIYRRNFKTDLGRHFNNMRTFALADERATVMCSYDDDTRPERPFPYFNEVMTGFEYTVATSMIFDGDRDRGLELIEAIRERYRGNRRNPFDEAECGYHYARAIASWSALVAWTGFSWNALDGHLTIDLGREDGRTFWSTGGAWGTWSQEVNGTAIRGRLTVSEGDLPLRTLTICGVDTAVTLTDGAAEVEILVG